MGATTPEQIDELMLAAYQAKDAEALADLYEDDAVFSNPPDGWTAVGRTEIVARMKEVFASLDGGIDWVSDPPVRTVEVGDYAFVHGTYRARVSLADGTRHEVVGRGTTVLHRGDDGNWRCVIDHSSNF